MNETQDNYRMTIQERKELIQQVIDRLLAYPNEYKEQLELLNISFDVKDNRIKPTSIIHWLELEDKGIEVN